MTTKRNQPTAPENPAGWHRRICRVPKSNVVVSGDLPFDREQALAKLKEWIAAGVTHIVDVRGEASDADFVKKHAPWITYVWAGTHDAGGSQSAAWFTSVLRALGDAVHDPDAVILVHCHMVVNRGPSMAHRILLEQGWDAVDALAAIRRARPIANVEYVTDSVRHFHGRTSDSFTPLRTDLERVRAWRAERPLDLSWIISRIRRAA